MSLARSQRDRVSSLHHITFRHPYLFTLLLLIVALAVNYYLQPNLLEPRVLNGNLRIFLPLMILAAGQAVVIIGGGIDLSVGTMVFNGQYNPGYVDHAGIDHARYRDGDCRCSGRWDGGRGF